MSMETEAESKIDQQGGWREGWIAGVLASAFRWVAGLKADSLEFADADWHRLADERHDNPVWRANNPGHRSARRKWEYTRTLGMIWGLPVAAFALGGLWPVREAALLWIALGFFVQPYVTLMLLRSHDFVGGRRWVLEDLALSGLDWKAIAFGSYNAGVLVSSQFVVAFVLTDFLLLFHFYPASALYGLPFFGFPRLFLYGLSLTHGMGALSSFKKQDAISLILLPLSVFVRLLVVAGIAVVGFVVLSMLSYLFVGEAALMLFLVLVFCVALVAWILLLAWGVVLIRRAYGEAARNFRRAFEDGESWERGAIGG